jgi:hypothetical protein
MGKLSVASGGERTWQGSQVRHDAPFEELTGMKLIPSVAQTLTTEN